VVLASRSRACLAGLYALTPDLADTLPLLQRVRAALAGGAAAIQYRNKAASPALRWVQARALREICTDASVFLIVNDDVELAASVAADGVHLGRDDATVVAARERLGAEAIIGASCYDSLERAQSAIEAGADYIAFGSFYASSVKPHAARPTPDLLSSAKRRWDIPLVAIGGITPDNAARLIAAGADAVAVMTAVFNAADVRAAARAFTSLFQRSSTN
jgi:thiamine-phosphate pyrophosphorylase